MNSQQWRDQLRHKLRQQNLPPAYIDRLLDELSDHLLDTQTENPSMEAQHAITRLGSTNRIAAAVTDEFRRRTFAGRHPWLTFVLFPFAFVPLLFVSLLAAVLAIGWLLGVTAEWLIVPESQWLSKTTESRLEWWILGAYDFYVRFVPFVLASWMFCRWGRRSGMRWWPLVACTIVAVTAGFIFTKSIPSMDDKPGLWMIGLATHFKARQVVQLLVPLAVAAWLMLKLPRAPKSASAQNAIAT
jgi:hypothetical protein